jgi:hypothetical protein
VKITSTLGAIGLAILGISLLVLRDATWTCAISLDTSPDRLLTTGTSLTVSEVDLGAGRAFSKGNPFNSLSGGLPGNQTYSFTYSENVDRIGIWLDQDLVYQGAPISAYDGSARVRAKRVRVRVEGSGNRFFVRISDQCSIREIVARLF